MVMVVVKQPRRASPKHCDDLERRSKLEAEGCRHTAWNKLGLVWHPSPHIYRCARGGGSPWGTTIGPAATLGFSYWCAPLHIMHLGERKGGGAPTPSFLPSGDMVGGGSASPFHLIGCGCTKAQYLAH